MSKMHVLWTSIFFKPYTSTHLDKIWKTDKFTRKRFSVKVRYVLSCFSCYDRYHLNNHGTVESCKYKRKGKIAHTFLYKNEYLFAFILFRIYVWLILRQNVPKSSFCALQVQGPKYPKTYFSYLTIIRFRGNDTIKPNNTNMLLFIAKYK